MEVKYKKVPMDYPLPNRQWFETEYGWASKKWTPSEHVLAMAHHYKLRKVDDRESRG